MLREVVDRNCVGGIWCALARAAGVYFQACAFNHSAISPFRIKDLRALNYKHNGICVRPPNVPGSLRPFQYSRCGQFGMIERGTGVLRSVGFQPYRRRQPSQPLSAAHILQEHQMAAANRLRRSVTLVLVVGVMAMVARAPGRRRGKWQRQRRRKRRAGTNCGQTEMPRLAEALWSGGNPFEEIRGHPHLRISPEFRMGDQPHIVVRDGFRD